MGMPAEDSCGFPLKRVLVLVLALDQEPWRSIEEQGQRGTWAARSDADCQTNVFWLHGKLSGPIRFAVRAGMKVLNVLGLSNSVERLQNLTGAWAARRTVHQDGHRIVTQVPETYINANAKTIAGLRYLLDHHDFDFLLRTNSSTYVNRPMLDAFARGLPSGPYYGGHVAVAGADRYASGACALLSRSAVEIVVNDPDWEYCLVDDIALGRSFARAGLDVQSFNRIDVSGSQQLQELNADVLMTSFVVRCKGLDTRDHDIVAMHRVHELYQGLGLA